MELRANLERHRMTPHQVLSVNRVVLPGESLSSSSFGYLLIIK
jgi:hypothetical protein